MQLAYDGDAAGQEATWRSWDLLGDTGAPGLRLADIPDGRDPASLAPAELAMALHIAGYDPCIGYYHQLSHARESLACDLLEPLRPLADRICLLMVAQQTLTPEHFSTTDAGCLLGKAGRTRYYAAYEDSATELRRALTGEVKALARLLNPQLPEPATTLTHLHGTADTPWPA